ncbi:MAG: hypothetical protein CSA95_05950 [Bacteroidetes bacterium]|nr:MAG: hypothetical protein CSA95_05950 [Bacteroidota bacterium]
MGKHKHLVLFLFLISILGESEAQQPYGFERYDQIVVFDAQGRPLNFPWVGGLNAPQFNTVLLNGDSLPDLVCFDRSGNRLLTFINEQNQWRYRPEYQSLFPDINHWMIMKDYNGDGRKDLFTYTTGGIQVFYNTGRDEERFLLMTDPYLTSLQGSMETNILVTYADYPGIVDLDFDGDLDILTFYGLGAFVEVHKNCSMELYGSPDSLVYEKSNSCWGYFAESEESNVLYLDTCLNGAGMPGKAERHTGSTFLLFDKDQDHDYDLWLGDVDYPSLLLLENGGDATEARITSVIKDYPPSSPVSLYSFPAAFLEDVDFDGLADLLVAPFDPSLRNLEVNHNILFYKNRGDNEFEFVTRDFLQDEMIEWGAGVYPSLFDWNGDGLLDLLLGNEGVNDTCFMDEYATLHCSYKSFLVLYENVGSLSEPAFHLVDDDFGGLFEYGIHGLHPAVGDVDGDGDADVVCGTAEGSFVWLENRSGSYPPQFLVHEEAFSGIAVDHNAAPALVDLDFDGDLDLVSGCRDGLLYGFENTSASSGDPSFMLSYSMLGGVDVRDLTVSYYGYSTPFFREDSEGALELFVGSSSGRIYLYDVMREDLSEPFPLVTSHLHYLDFGERVDCSLADLNGDAYPELVVGLFAGGAVLYKGTSPSEIVEKEQRPSLDFFPNPANQQVTLGHDVWKYLPLGVEIYTLSGRMCSQQITADGVIDLSSLNEGVYCLRIFKLDTGESYGCQRIVKMTR